MTDLPALNVTPDQARIAERDRADALDALDAEIRRSAGNQPAELVDQLAAIYREVALRNTRWSWWTSRSLNSSIGQAVQRQLTPEDRARIAVLATKRH